MVEGGVTYTVQEHRTDPETNLQHLFLTLKKMIDLDADEWVLLIVYQTRPQSRKYPQD